MKAQKVLQSVPARPVLKWAGGKTQLLDALRTRIPKKFNRYIEPFVGGGALFFDLTPRHAVIADLNPELINLYQCLQRDYTGIVRHLASMVNDEEVFYTIRALDFNTLEPMQAAARTLYLNRTCYNGLYRVNRKGQFNVPFGRYKNPAICQPESLQAAAQVLTGATIILGSYQDILKQHAHAGDFVFLNPPYLPVGEYSDFKPYTKEQFHEEDHRELAEEVLRLQTTGCHVVLTNSNHPLVHELYAGFEMDVINTRRNISSRAATRTGEDVIITAKPAPRALFRLVPDPIPEQAERYPPTRYMGSKEKLLPWIKSVVENFQFDSVADLFSGSGTVGYMFKNMGKQVFSNDYMAMSATFAKAMIENSTHTLTLRETDLLFSPVRGHDRFVQETFQGVYYPDEENAVIDLVRANIRKITNPHKRAIALSALIRACMKKRARGIFTYTGMRYDDGRADLTLSMQEQIRRAVTAINAAVFDNGKACTARFGDAMQAKTRADLVYLDPPYFSPLSDNEYVRRYHFVEGLARDWDGVDIQWHTKTRKFKSYPTPFSSQVGATAAFDHLFKKLKDSILVVSYSSNSLPTKDEMLHLMATYKRHVEVFEIDHRYSFANQGDTGSDIRNQVKEYLFVGF